MENLDSVRLKRFGYFSPIKELETNELVRMKKKKNKFILFIILFFEN
jgi:hypothetical protein